MAEYHETIGCDKLWAWVDYDDNVPKAQIRDSLAMARRIRAGDTSKGSCPISSKQSSTRKRSSMNENEFVIEEFCVLMDAFHSDSRLFLEGYFSGQSPRVYDRRMASALRLLQTVFAAFSLHEDLDLEFHAKLIAAISNFLRDPLVWSIIEGQLVHKSGGISPPGLSRTGPFPFVLPDYATVRTLQAIRDMRDRDWLSIAAQLKTLAPSPHQRCHVFPSIRDCSRLLDWLERQMPGLEEGLVLPPVLGGLIILTDDMVHEDLVRLSSFREEQVGRLVKEGKVAVRAVI